MLVNVNQGFVEIHSPKLLAGASEGGSEVFMTDYFGQPACLAQSPQLYKQMAAACGGFERVMEVCIGSLVHSGGTPSFMHTKKPTMSCA